MSRAAKFDKHELGLAVFFFFDKIKLAFHTHRDISSSARHEMKQDMIERVGVILYEKGLLLI